MFYLVEFFDKESNSVSDHHSQIPKHILIGLQTGSLTAQLSNNPQKINCLAGITLATIIQSIACLIAGSASVLGLAFIWRVGLVAMGMLTSKFSFLILTQAYNHRSACLPLLISLVYIWLVRFSFHHRLSCTQAYAYKLKHVVVLKDQMKNAHAESARWLDNPQIQ